MLDSLEKKKSHYFQKLKQKARLIELINYTDDMNNFFIEFTPGHSEKEIQEEFHRRFGILLSLSQIGNRKTKLKVRSGTKGGCFEKGHVPVNKGKKQYEYMSEEAIKRTLATRFKKGNVPYNHKEIGALSFRERKSADRTEKYWYIKIKDNSGHDNFELLHRYVWKQYNGEIPPKHKVMFINGDINDVRIENLVLVSYREELKMATKHCIDDDPERTMLNLNILRIDELIKEKIKEI